MKSYSFPCGQTRWHLQLRKDVGSYHRFVPFGGSGCFPTSMPGDRLTTAAFEGLRRMFNYTGGGLIYVRAPWLQGGSRATPKHRILPAYLFKAKRIYNYVSNEVDGFFKGGI